MKKAFLILLSFMLVLSASGCAPQSITQDHYALDTILSITLYDTQDSSILQQCWDRADELEAVLSRTRPGSDIFRINHAAGQPVEVTNETVEILQLALEIAEKSQGALDISIGSVVKLWDFKAANPSPPDSEALEKAVECIDYRQIKLEGNKVTIPKGMELDLGGIAKGYIADQLLLILQESKCDCALLNLGGNVLTYGIKSGNSLWNIGIRDPNGDASQALLALSYSGTRSVVTSGIYERGFVLDGQRYHHILDPKTGMPVWNELVSVTILSSSSALADGLSTACFVLGKEDGITLLESYSDTEGFFLMKDGTQFMTSGFLDYVHTKEKP